MGYTEEGHDAVAEILLQNLGRMEMGEKLLNVVDLKRGY